MNLAVPDSLVDDRTIKSQCQETEVFDPKFVVQGRFCVAFGQPLLVGSSLQNPLLSCTDGFLYIDS